MNSSQLYKILVIALTLCLFTIAMHAQASNASLDSLNVYQQLIIELESKGVNLVQLFDDEELAKGLKQFDIDLDSLKYYYYEKYFPDGIDSSTVEKGYTALLAKAYGDSIILRWGPTTFGLWNKVKKDGFRLLRVKLMEDDQGRMLLMDTSINSIALMGDSTAIIKPWTLEEIGEVIQETDTSAAVAAQAMYGSSFSGGVSADSLDFVSRYKEAEMRFSMALLMADRSGFAADIMGLRYVDRDIEPGNGYMYLLYPIGLSTEFAAMVQIVNDPTQNVAIRNLGIHESDGFVSLYWPKSLNQFSGYWIERSTDAGATWHKLTKQPVVFMENPPRGDRYKKPNKQPSGLPFNPEDHYIFKDTVTNYVTYSYRVSGQTPFADFSGYAYVEGSTSDLTAPPPPRITKYEVNEETNIALLEWHMDYLEDQLADLAGFAVWEAVHPDSTFAQISDMLPASARSYRSPKPLEKERSHYYILKSVDDKGNERSSFPLYMHVIDDIPPAAPLNPAYLIDDSTGVVMLVWEANTEKDLLGYRVYFSNSLENEFTQLTKRSINRNIYYDTIALVTLTEKIYYKIQAEDASYNSSEFSEILEVNRPDHVAPVAPVMEHPEITSDYIKLIWRPSSSIDVEKQILYRRMYMEKEWQVFQEFENPALAFYTDTTAKVEQLYEYTMRVVDDVGHYSDYAFPVKGRRWFGDKIPAVNNIVALYDKESKSIALQWGFDPPEHEILEGVDYVYYIYRSTGDSQVMRYRLLNSEEASFTDMKLADADVFNYAVKVVYKNGKASPLSQLKTIRITK